MNFQLVNINPYMPYTLYVKLLQSWCAVFED